ncbi:hypothetical protein CKO51_15190 [Rhodopirellula sp. SM50]|nr:hypothetical protein CKO51_15190 [Rhodopirellula sp. SM50]
MYTNSVATPHPNRSQVDAAPLAIAAHRLHLGLLENPSRGSISDRRTNGETRVCRRGQEKSCSAWELLRLAAVGIESHGIESHGAIESSSRRSAETPPPPGIRSAFRSPCPPGKNHSDSILTVPTEENKTRS